MKHPERKPAICAYFGHHRSASTWISEICSLCCRHLELKFARIHSPRKFGNDLAGFVRRHNLDFIAYTNANAKHTVHIPNMKGFHVVRDPRDILISAYFSHRYSHPITDWPALARHRENLARCGKAEGLFLEMGFLRGVFHQIESWNYNCEEILEMRYPQFAATPLESFSAAFNHLGLLEAITMPVLEKIIHLNRFQVVSGGRVRGEPDPLSHYRQGCPGDWKHHLTKKHIERFFELYGSLMEKLGYAD